MTTGSGGGGQDDDDGFLYYVPSTVDLGGGLLVGSVFCFLIGYGLVLPLLVAWGRRRRARQKAGIENTFCIDDDEDDDDDSPERVVVDTRHMGLNNQQQPDGDGSIAQSSFYSYYSKLSSSSSVSRAIESILEHPPTAHTKSARRRRRRKLRENIDIHTHNLLQGIHPGGITSCLASPTTTDPYPPGEASSWRSSEFASCREEEEEEEEEGQGLNAAQRTAPRSTPPRYASDFDAFGVLDKLGIMAEWDIETRRILRLSTPYCTQAFVTGMTDTINLAVIGRKIGTPELSAFVIVNLLVVLTSEFVGGLHEALASLCSQAIGAGNKKLAGQYCQIVLVLYTLFFIPCMVVWAVYMGPILRWFGFDEETVAIGVQYNYILVVDLLIDGLGETVHGFLDVAGFEKFSTLIGATEEILATIVLLVAAMTTEMKGLVGVGLIQLGLGVVFLAINIMIIFCLGWFAPYSEGMIGSFALFNGNAVWLVGRTALSLSFGMLLTDGEWEILTIFASFLGPAEVAAWGILDTIWGASHELIDALADAGEVRCAFLLGSGDPSRAKVSAYKSILIGTFLAFFITSAIYMAGEDLPTWLTSDPTLQHLLRDLLPLFGLTNLVMALDTMSWTLLGSQGRYRLATIIVCLCSWCVTIPLAALFSVHLNVNLQGQMTAFLLGYLIMGMIHTFFLLVSDWDMLSQQVMEDNEAIKLMTEETPRNSTAASNSRSTSKKSGRQSWSFLPSPTLLPSEVASGKPRRRMVEDHDT